MTGLLHTSAFGVAEFRCPGTPEVTEVEAAPYPEIVLPRQGSYLRSDAMGEVLLNRTTLAFFEANAPYTIRHFRPTPDVTTVISITDTPSLHEALGIRPLGARAFARSAIRMPPELVLAHRQMLKQIALGVDGRLAAEEVAANIILCSLTLNLEDRSELTQRTSLAGGKDKFAIAEAVAEYLSEAYANKVTIEDVAVAVGLSPFYLCRVFQAATGGTIHQHLLSLRLEAAATQLLDTDDTITQIAHDVGFSSHSHMTALFTRTFGVPPRQVRENQLQYVRRRNLRRR